MKLHLFNPENDLALGLNCRHYTPPPHAAAIHRAGALLPMWWAEDDDLILAPECLREEAGRLAARFGLKGQVCGDVSAFTGLSGTAPWGWSLDARRQFLCAGVRPEILPTDSAIDRMRLLSHRRMSIEIINRLDGHYPIAIETDNPDRVVELEKSHPGCFIKSPWSGSGRGVFCARSLDSGALHRRAEGIIHRQGSVMVEKGLDKVADFAVLFHCGKHRAEFMGLSLFQTEARGMYNGNLVAPQGLLWDRFGQFGLTAELERLIAQLEPILTALISGDYDGWAGIDMMVYRGADGQLEIMPCVELNLRMTMGVAAMKIAQRLGCRDIRFLGWEHRASGDDNTEKEASTNAGSLVILPPSDGFTLRLTPMADCFQQ